MSGRVTTERAREIAIGGPRCPCGNAATCHGTYDGVRGYGCDECCGHGCEDGACDYYGEERLVLAEVAADRDAHRQRANAAEAEVATSRALADALRESDVRVRQERDDVRADVARLRELAVDLTTILHDLAAGEAPPREGPCAAHSASVGASLRALVATQAEVARLRAIVAGRSDAPTDAEWAAHEASGGSWRWVVTRGDGAALGGLSGEGPWPPTDPLAGVSEHVTAGAQVRWWALDAARCPCAWPVTP